MKKYSPLLSVAAGCVLLLLPIGILALASPAPQNAERRNSSVAVDADPRVVEELEELSQRLAELETQFEEFRQEQSQPATAPPAPASANPVAELAQAAPVAADPGAPPEQPAPAKDPSVPRPAPQKSLTVSLIGSWLAQLVPSEAEPQPDGVETRSKVEQPARTERSPRTDTLRADVATNAAEEPAQAIQVASKQFEQSQRTSSQRLVETEPAKAKKPPARPASSTRMPAKERDSKSRAKKPTPRGDAMPAEDAVPVEPFGGAADIAAVEHLIDVGISRPQPGNVVGRWENLVATTLEPGWPVVLVRSEAKGDSWWVQQVVARHGNVIGAKVNFGNVETISAHRFELVVLLLDNSAQAVRFRTAREFKSIPPGVRRSKIFRYVRG